MEFKESMKMVVKKKKRNLKVKKGKESAHPPHKTEINALAHAELIQDSTHYKGREEWEKEVVRRPDSVEVWVQFMSYVYEEEGLEAARRLGKRALAVINFRDDNARMALWKARINLEFHFGTPKSTADLFKLAINSVDHFKMATHLISL